MPIKMQLWQVNQNGELIEISNSRLDTENQLEQWLSKDPSLLSPDLLVIGKQVETSYGGKIDLLCIDPEGDLVIVELKRDKTPRDVVAQALDYASWVRNLSREDIEAIAEKYLKKKLEKAFEEEFESELPDVLNEAHQILIVAAEIDAATERIVKYLVEEYQVGINVVFFSCFKDQTGNLYIGRSWLLEPEEVEDRAEGRSGSKRRTRLTFEQFRELAFQNGVGEIYDELLTRIKNHTLNFRRTKSNVAFTLQLGESKKTFLSVYPGESSAKMGLKTLVRPERIAQAFGVELSKVKQVLPGPGERKEHHDHESELHYFRSKEDINKLIEFLNAISKQSHS